MKRLKPFFLIALAAMTLLLLASTSLSNQPPIQYKNHGQFWIVDSGSVTVTVIMNDAQALINGTLTTLGSFGAYVTCLDTGSTAGTLTVTKLKLWGAMKEDRVPDTLETAWSIGKNAFRSYDIHPDYPILGYEITFKRNSGVDSSLFQFETLKQ